MDVVKDDAVILEKDGLIDGNVTGNIKVTGSNVTLTVKGNVTGNISGATTVNVDGNNIGNTQR